MSELVLGPKGLEGPKCVPGLNRDEGLDALMIYFLLVANVYKYGDRIAISQES